MIFIIVNQDVFSLNLSSSLNNNKIAKSDIYGVMHRFNEDKSKSIDKFYNLKWAQNRHLISKSLLSSGSKNNWASIQPLMIRGTKNANELYFYNKVKLIYFYFLILAETCSQ